MRLSALLRSVLRSGPEFSTLADELKVLSAYLDIEHARFEDRLKVQIEVSDELLRFKVPTLLLQPIVENAVKHGIAKSLEGCEILVELAQSEQCLYQLKVSNSGKPFVDEDSKGTGLANTRARLELLYGKLHQFSITADERGGTVASFYFSGEKID